MLLGIHILSGILRKPKTEIISMREGKRMEEEIKVNKNCVNAKIQAHILPESEMRKIGFTDHVKDNWYFCRMLRFPKKKLYRDFEISFSVTIPKNSDDIRIDVLDEAFCQPYDYQRILYDHPNHETALIVQNEGEKWMDYLQKKGVLSGHVRGEYI